MKRVSAVLAGISLSLAVGMPAFAAEPVNTSAAFFSWLSAQGSLTDAQRNDARKAYALITGGNTSGVDMGYSPRVPLSETFAQTNLADPQDATSLSHLSDSVDAVQTCNELRAGEGKSPYAISSTLMAIGEINANYGDIDSSWHTLTFNTGENLAWGYGNADQAFYGWYDEEKPYQGGHYQNIVGGYNVTGFGMTGNRTYAQEFDYYYPGISVSAYKNYVDTYENTYNEVHLLYSKASDNYFYLYDPDVIAQLVAAGFEDRGVYFATPAFSSAPVYQMADSRAKHYYSVNENEAQALAANGWTIEGVAFYSASPDTGIPVYCVFNAPKGEYIYTTDENEKESLIASGFTDGGTAFYALPYNR